MMTNKQDYYEALNQITQPIRASQWKFTLEPMQALLAKLNLTSPAFETVLVAGSIGKGSMSWEIAQRLQSAGLNVGLFISPHLHLFRERFHVNGAMISHETFTALAQETMHAAKTLPYHFSTFEYATAIACLWFSANPVDYAVFECGLGGRFDATNAISHHTSVLMTVELEHRAILGGDLTQIAQHKTGIITEGGQVFTVPQASEVMDAIITECDHKQATLTVTPSDEIARALLSQLHLPVEPARLKTNLPARLEWVAHGQQTWLIDGGHTPQSAVHLRKTLNAWKQRHPHMTLCLMISMLRDKAPDLYLNELLDLVDHVITVSLPVERAFSASDLCAYLPSSMLCTTLADVQQAVQTAEAMTSDLVVVCGSFRLAGRVREILSLLTPEELEEAQHTRLMFEGTDYQTRWKEGK